ncbi:MAG: nucleotidyl transferase [Candidatus Aenigmarchaeota archaeon]|nr:nucleotidyl transferase [Pseudomonadota bacterium]NIO23228.1 nucleotidyl transferase [Candidatus Aenigmarchaeota archaeon]NIQ18105.1 nucleotidyl transferase [Candidatus Aenigmarchaeota archaeon]
MDEEIVGLIPAAGIGKRLYPFSRAVPKEMYPILGKAVIEHSIENLKVGGINKIYMIVGFQKGALMDYIGDGSFFGVNVVYIYQLRRKGLGHGVLQGGGWIDKTFVTLLGDSFIEPKEELRELIDYHRKERPVATVMLFEVKDTEGYGVVKFKNLKDGVGPVERMAEKPSKNEAEKLKSNGKFYAICGAYVFEPKIFEYLGKTKPGLNKEIQLTDAMSLALKNGEKINGFVLKGKYIDIGKWKTVLKTEKELLNNLDIDLHTREREKIMEKVRKHEEDEE